MSISKTRSSQAIVFLLSMTLPHGAVGFSAVCECVISWSHSVTYSVGSSDIIALTWQVYVGDVDLNDSPVMSHAMYRMYRHRSDCFPGAF